jgi:hypothetical protein
MIIAERILKYAAAGGTIAQVPIRLFAPETNGKDWSCRYTIGWPDGLYNGTGHGIDQFQAVILTLQRIGTDIYFSDYHKTGQLYFEKLGSGYGFPVPKNARDLLVGDDKRFDE